MTDEIAPQEMFKIRKQIKEHFAKKRQEINERKFGGLGGIFAKGRLFSIIASREGEAMDEVEKNHWTGLEQILAKCDKEIEEESEPFMSKSRLVGLGEK